MSFWLVVLGASVGAASVLGGMLVAGYLLAPRIGALEGQAAQANDRLYQSWKDGNTIPAPEHAPLPPAAPARDPVVEDWLAQYDAAGQVAYRARADRLVRDGWEAPAVLKMLERVRSQLESPFS